MANIKSAKKRILVNKTKNENNVPKKSSMKTAIKKAFIFLISPLLHYNIISKYTLFVNKKSRYSLDSLNLSTLF